MKYPPEIAEKFIQQSNEIEVLTKEYDSSKFAIPIKQNLYITKKKSEADFMVSVADGSKNKVSIVKELKDPANTHKYSFKNIITAVSNRLKKNNIYLGYSKGFNSYVLNLFIDFYDIKGAEKYAYKHTLGNHESYTYSERLIDFIIEEIKKNPEGFVDSLKNKK